MNRKINVTKEIILTVIIILLGFGLLFYSLNRISRWGSSTQPHFIEDELEKRETIVIMQNELVRLNKIIDDLQKQNKALKEQLKKRQGVERKNKAKAEAIRRVLNRYHAPLARYADTFVLYANKYGIDWRLVASISIAESSGGRICFKPYNAWGYGHYSFKSFNQGIQTVAYGLARYYYARGCRTVTCINKKYSMGSKTWLKNVNTVMAQITREYNKLIQGYNE